MPCGERPGLGARADRRGAWVAPIADFAHAPTRADEGVGWPRRSCPPTHEAFGLEMGRTRRRVSAWTRASSRRAQSSPTSGPTCRPAFRGYFVSMTENTTSFAYTVAAFASEGEEKESVAVYGILATSPHIAVEAVRQMMPRDVHVELAGTLSRKVARALRLKQGEARRL